MSFDTVHRQTEMHYFLAIPEKCESSQIMWSVWIVDQEFLKHCTHKEINIRGVKCVYSSQKYLDFHGSVCPVIQTTTVRSFVIAWPIHQLLPLSFFLYY